MFDSSFYSKGMAATLKKLTVEDNPSVRLELSEAGGAYVGDADLE